ncbi:semaphorin-6C isoform X4 [Manis pentadactyla]|uniref:semaphorin-6C isoform X4 n=1 Tax=Manis pentadactyla TaxID=143292 RepID=UPI00255C7606|nr:semaphorin-6C isoform X4 [Manis pentadactyla]
MPLSPTWPSLQRAACTQPLLRTSRPVMLWFTEASGLSPHSAPPKPHFVHALEHGDHVYFFFREVSVEDVRLGRVQFSRVARVCKRDMGGSPRVLDRHWTSFLKLRLNCSVPGDSTFYFDVLQALTGPMNLYGRSAVFGIFTTQTNSIPGSAVCAFYLDDIEHGFEGKFKEQRSLDGAWTPVSEDRVPSPRPGSCAGVGVAALFPSSRDLPDDVLTFIKAHPLLDPAVPPASHQPLLTLTSRAQLTQVAVDGMAGPYSNTTVLFLGSNNGTVLKVLPPGGQSRGREPILLEEIDAYSPSRCSGKRAAQTAQQVIGLELDTEGHRLFVAFPGCIISISLSRCARHGACRRSCLASQDPYCGWHSSRGCVNIRGSGGIDVDLSGNQESIEYGDCQDGATGSQAGTGDSAYGESCPTSPSIAQPTLTQVCAHSSSKSTPWATCVPEKVLLGPGPSPETPSSPSDAHPWPQSSTLGAHTQGVRQDLPPASASLSVPIPLLLACVATAFALGASVSGLLVSCACRRAHRPRSKDVETPALPRPLSLRSLVRLHGAGPEPLSLSKEGDWAQTPELYTTYLSPAEGVPPPEVACLPTPESTPELPVKYLRNARGSWEWNQNGNNDKEGPGRARRGHAAGGPVPRVLVRPPPPGCPGQAVEVTTLEELLRYLHGPQPARNRTEPPPPAPFTSRALRKEPAPTLKLLAGSKSLPQECPPPVRLDMPPEEKCVAPSARPVLSVPAPRLGVGGSRRLPFSHRAPPALLTRVPSGGPSRYSRVPGRHLLYLGRPEGYRGCTPKRADVGKPQLSPKPPLIGLSSQSVAPNGGHFNF